MQSPRLTLARASASHSRYVPQDSSPPKGNPPPIGFLPSFSVVPLRGRRRFTTAQASDKPARLLAARRRLPYRVRLAVAPSRAWVEKPSLASGH